MSINTITRKIEIRINQEDYKPVFEKLYDWNEKVFRAYNFVATHLYIQKNIKEFFYFNEDFIENFSSIKIVDAKKDPEGVLNTSKQNTTYQVLSNKFKGDLPTSILTSINQEVGSVFAKEQKEYFSGARSLRTYRRGAPMPFVAKEMRNIALTEDGKNYAFTLFGFPFRTNFGRDLSGNKGIFERGLSNEYKFCGSSLQLSGKKIFLLAVFQFESRAPELNPKKSVVVRLDHQVPMLVTIGKKTVKIGSKEEFLHRRLQIRHGMYRTQSALKYNTGGKGRKKKMHKIEEWEDKEKNYVETRLHTYSRELIKICLREKAATIYIDEQPDLMKSLEDRIKDIQSNEDLSKKEKYDLIEESKFVLSSWSYYGLLNKIEYKAKQDGIKVETLKN